MLMNIQKLCKFYKSIIKKQQQKSMNQSHKMYNYHKRAKKRLIRYC